jgi:hypothetical protein
VINSFYRYTKIYGGIMGLLDNGLKENVLTGLAIGVGAAILAPAVLPALAGAAKPVLKAAIKVGLVLYEKGKETFAEMSEITEDVIAEAKAEVAEGHREATPAPSPEGEAEA